MDISKITLEYFRGKGFPFHINQNLSVFRLKDLINDLYKMDYEVYLPSIEMNLQRGHVWTLLQKQSLIFSILKGIKMPPMVFIKKEDDTFEVIDGKQRLTTIISFCKNEFQIPIEGEEYYFYELPDELKKEIQNHWVNADVGYSYKDDPISDEDKIRWFELINFSGTVQEQNHLDGLKRKLKSQ